MPPSWRLPPGVPPGAWDYAASPHIAEGYDDELAAHPLFDVDEEIVARWFVEPGVVVDLGCGTGRSLLPLARRGFTTVGVDLSPSMLGVVGEKASLADVTIHRLRANIAELDGLRDQSVDYALCLFSTLGMLRPRAMRAAACRHAHRVLRDGGLFVLHGHNTWYNLFDAAGRAWLVRHAWQCMTDGNVEWGDRTFSHRGIARMFVHSFTLRELRRLLRRAGFQIEDILPLDAARQRPLRWRSFLSQFRANGWVIVARKPRASSPHAKRSPALPRQ